MLPGGTVYARPFVERLMKVANRGETVWIKIQEKVRKILTEHY
jgi:hypothetical protein